MASDIVPATRDALAEALRGREIVAGKLRDGTSHEHGGPPEPYVVVTARYPEELAEELMGCLDARWRAELARPAVPLPPAEEEDAEPAAMAVIVSALDALDDAEVARVLRWACDRYGT